MSPIVETFKSESALPPAPEVQQVQQKKKAAKLNMMQLDNRVTWTHFLASNYCSYLAKVEHGPTRHCGFIHLLLKEAGPPVEDFSFIIQFPQIFWEMASFSNFHGSLLSCGVTFSIVY